MMKSSIIALGTAGIVLLSGCSGVPIGPSEDEKYVFPDNSNFVINKTTKDQVIDKRGTPHATSKEGNKDIIIYYSTKAPKSQTSVSFGDHKGSKIESAYTFVDNVLVEYDDIDAGHVADAREDKSDSNIENQYVEEVVAINNTDSDNYTMLEDAVVIDAKEVSVQNSDQNNAVSEEIIVVE